MNKIKKFSVFVFSLSISIGVSAERYSVIEDSFGGLSAEPVEVGTKNDKVPANNETFSKNESEVSANPLILEPNNKAEGSKGLSAEKEMPLESISTSNSPKISGDAQSEHKTIEAAVGDRQKDAIPDTEEKNLPNKLSVFEKVYLESERKAKAQVLKNLGVNKIGQETSGAYDATEINPIKFVDGDELERTGGREEVEKAPYFITVDADGKLQNTFYDPVLVGEALDKQRNKKIEYTQARVYEKISQQDGGELELPEAADPIAVKLLNSGKKEFDLYYDAFTKQCCDQLPNIVTPTVQMGRSQAFQLTDEDLYYRFSDGDSRFLLVGLPSETNKNYPLRIRTFIRTFKKLSINHGVFFPQIVTLNADKKPVRIMTGPLLKYQAETWSTHGYLEGMFQIDRSEDRDERYVLINTTNNVLRQSSIIDSEEPIEIAHMPVGSFEIEAILEE